MLSIFVSFFIPFLFVVTSTVLYIYLFKKRLTFEQVLPISLIVFGLFVYLFTLLFHTISVGFWLYIAILIVGVTLFLTKDSLRLRTLRKYLFTPGFLAFCVLYTFIFILNFGRQALQWDEYMHWMPFVQDMLRINDFYTSAANTAFVVHGSYPPIIPLFEVLWVKLSGGFQEHLLYNALQVLCLSMLLPVFSKISWSSKINKHRALIVIKTLTLLILLVSSVLVINLYDAAEQRFTFFTSIYIDAALGCMFFYGVYLIYTRTQRALFTTLIPLSLLISFLVISKEIGLVFSAVIIGYFLLDIALEMYSNQNLHLRYISQKIRIYNKYNRSLILPTALLLLLPVICLGGWSIQKNAFLDRGDGISQFSISEFEPWKVPSILLDRYGTEDQQTSAKNFLSHIIHSPVILNTDLFKITYLQFTILLITLFFIIVSLSKIERKRTTLLATSMLLGWLCYAFFMMNMYLFGGFRDNEQTDLASVDRYLGTYLLALILTLLYLLFDRVRLTTKRQVAWFFASTGIVWGLFFNISALNSVIPYKLQKAAAIDTKQTILTQVKETTNTIRNDPFFSLRESSVILIDCDYGPVFETQYFRYAFRPKPLLIADSGGKLKSTTMRNIAYVDIKNSFGPVDAVIAKSSSVYAISLCGAEKMKTLNLPVEFNYNRTKDKYQVYRYIKQTTGLVKFQPIQ